MKKIIIITLSVIFALLLFAYIPDPKTDNRIFGKEFENHIKDRYTHYLVDETFRKASEEGYESVQQADMRLGALVRIGLIDLVMGLAQCRYLRQVGDGNDLAGLRHVSHDGRHLCRYLTAHTRVYLIEDDGRQAFGAGDERFYA